VILNLIMRISINSLSKTGGVKSVLPPSQMGHIIYDLYGETP
jgi:hypothetical protein